MAWISGHAQFRDLTRKQARKKKKNKKERKTRSIHEEQTLGILLPGEGGVWEAVPALLSSESSPCPTPGFNGLKPDFTRQVHARSTGCVRLSCDLALAQPFPHRNPGQGWGHPSCVAPKHGQPSSQWLCPNTRCSHDKQRCFCHSPSGGFPDILNFITPTSSPCSTLNPSSSRHKAALAFNYSTHTEGFDLLDK